jgi:hypothetical protein
LRPVERRRLDSTSAMTHDVLVNRAQIFEQALALAEDDRLKLAVELLASSPPPGIFRVGSPELAEAIEERIDSVRRGETKPVPARAALARLRRSHPAR